MASEEEYQTVARERDTLLIEDYALQHGFVQLPNIVLWASNLSADGKILYAVLLGYAWQEGRCFPGYARLCLDLGASENKVRRYMRELEDMGLVRQKRRGLGLTNIYTLASLRTSKIEVLDHHKTKVLEGANLEVLEPPKLRGKNTQSEKDPEKHTPPVAPQRGARSTRRRRAEPPDPARFTTGAYGVCPQCGCNPCDEECPSLLKPAATSAAIETPAVARRRAPAK